MTNGEQKILQQLFTLSQNVSQLSKDVKALHKVQTKGTARATALRKCQETIQRLRAEASVRDSLQSALGRFLGEEEMTHDHEKAVKKKFRFERNQ